MGVYALPVLYTTSAFSACVQNRFSESRSDRFSISLSWQSWESLMPSYMLQGEFTSKSRNNLKRNAPGHRLTQDQGKLDHFPKLW
jgi:hypothetical protein